MSIFVNKSSRVVIQGLTGQHGSFHAEESIKIGTNVVAGVTPGKGGTTHLGIPLFDTVHEAVARTGADVAGIFVPPPFAADAIMEAIDTGIRTIVVVADGIPVQDMVRVKRYSAGRDVVIVGPNTPGLITPNECKVGIMPAHIYKPGKIGVVSRSGTLNYEAVEQMAEYKLGQSTCVGIGGDTVTGTDFLTVMRAFKDDPDTEAVVMIGEIGGSRSRAAAWAKKTWANRWFVSSRGWQRLTATHGPRRSRDCRPGRHGGGQDGAHRDARRPRRAQPVKNWRGRAPRCAVAQSHNELGEGKIKY
jgi:succinyl-CoA synthetase alpha subunit/malate-CoA ligase subunit alpha